MNYSVLGNSPLENSKFHKFTNILPFDLDVIIIRGNSTVKKFSIKASNETSTSGLMNDDEIHVLRDGQEFLRPTYLRGHINHVTLGDIVYDSRDTSIINVNTDISGFRVNNNTKFPISVYYKNYKLGVTRCDDGGSYMGGSKNSVFVDNDRCGFKLGDEVQIMFDNGLYYATATLNDVFISDMYVGMITQRYNFDIRDNPAYNFC